MTSLVWLLALAALTGCSWFGVAKKSTAVVARPMVENVDIVGVERGAIFAAPANGAIFTDSFYIDIREAVAAGNGGEVYPVRGITWFPLAAGDTIAAPARGIFASERWQKYGMKLKMKE